MSSALKKISKPKTKKVKPRGLSVAHIKLGGEPQLTNPSKIELISALNWYNRTNTTPDQRRDWVLAFMEAEGFTKDELKEFSAKSRRFLPSFAHLARLIGNGSDIEVKHYTSLKNEIKSFVKKNIIDELDEEGNLIATATVVPIKSSRSERLADRLVEIIDAEMDSILEGNKPSSVVDKLTAAGITPAAAKVLKDFYKPQTSEFAEVYRGKDDQLNEGYARFSKKTRKAISTWMSQLILDLVELESAKKKSARRAPTARKKRAVKPENIVKWMKFAKEDTALKLTSIDPVKIVGAQTVWMYNTKNRMLGYMTATAPVGLSVKGASVIGGKGEWKKLRQPEATLVGFSSATKAATLSKFVAVKAVASENNGRVNANVVLLKVF